MTPDYSAPETFRGLFLSESDYFSLGITVALPTPYYQDHNYDCFTVSDPKINYSQWPKYAKLWLLRNLSHNPRYSSWWYPDGVEIDTLSKKPTIKEVYPITSEATVRPAIYVSLLPGLKE